MGTFATVLGRSKYFCKMEGENKLQINMDDKKPLKTFKQNRFLQKYQFIVFIINLTNI